MNFYFRLVEGIIILNMRKTVIAIILFLGIYGLYFWGTPWILNSKPVSNFVVQIVQNQINLPIQFDNLKFKTAFPFSLEINTGSIKLENSLRVKDVSLRLRIFPLVFKNLYLDETKINSLNLEFNLSKDRDLKVENFSIKDIHIPFNIKKINAALTNYNFVLKDDITDKIIKINSNADTNFVYGVNQIAALKSAGQINSGFQNSDFDISFALRLPLSNLDTHKSTFDGKIENLNLSDFAPYLAYFSDGKYQSVRGIVNLNAKTVQSAHSKVIKTDFSVDNLELSEIEKEKSIKHDGVLKFSSLLSFAHNTLAIKDVNVSGNKFHITSSGLIKNISGENKNLDINIIINKSRTEDLIKLMPAIEFEDVNLAVLKENPFYGDIIGNLSIEGNFKTPNITGNVLAQNGYLIKPIFNAKGADIRLNFDKKILNLNVNVPTSKDEYVSVNGPIELYGNKNADLKITSSKSVDLATAQFVLNPLHQILKFIIGPVPIMTINGKGNIDLRVVGNKMVPHAYGSFNFKDAAVSFNDIKNMLVTGGSGTLIFDNTDTNFKTEKALLNGKNINIIGTCNLEGKFDFDVETLGQNSGNLLKTLKTSPMLAQIASMLEFVEYSTGLADLNLKIKGQVKDPKEMEFLKNVFASGTLKMYDNLIKLKDLNEKVSKLNGNVNFDNTDLKLALSAFLNDAKLNINGTTKDNIANILFKADSLKLIDFASAIPTGLPYKKDLETILISLDAKYTGSVDKIDYSKINLKGKIYSNEGKADTLLVKGSNFNLANSEFNLSKMSGSISGNDYDMKLNIKNILNPSQKINAELKFKQLDLVVIDTLKDIFKSYLPKELQMIQDIKGQADVTAKIINNKVRAFTNLENVSLNYLPQNVHFLIGEGNILLQDNNININRLNSNINEMPIFINGKISDITNKNPYINLYINAKPTQDFADKFINANARYPVKVKGDVKVITYLKGYLNNLNTKSNIEIDKGSSIYYMGSTIGNDDHLTNLNADINILANKLKINDFRYRKVPLVEDGSIQNVQEQIQTSGEIYFNNKNQLTSFKNLKIKTANESDARIFNIIFKKPVIKKGNFVCDLLVNGSIENPKAVGNLEVKGVDMPFYNSMINDISMDLRSDKILAELAGNILSNEVKFKGVMKNKLFPPFVVENVSLNLKDLNLDIISETLRDYEVESTKNKISNNQELDLSMFLIDKAEISAERIKAKNISATDFKASGKLDEKMLFTVNDYIFTLAHGKIFGSAYYNLLNHNTGMKMHMDNANAQIMSEALFDLKNQVYGSITGDVALTCNGREPDSCVKTLSGEGYFEIKDGKMPKLGSLEYLLKAGNLLTGGLTGISINGIVDLITPLKTGEFESISGDFSINEGIAEKINVYSKGKDLNMYMTGSYNISNAFANMEIFGSLSNKVTSVFSKIKSVSLNTLLNTIPGVNKDYNVIVDQNEIAKIPNEKNTQNIYKIFKAEINGDINGSNYVKSFKWVK